jgi:glycosyltransferase involved in cell wall biosynthesis
MRLTPWFFFFLRALYKKGYKIILEIPKYPYDKEYGPGILTLSDHFFRRYLHRIVLGVSYVGSENSSIWGMPSKSICNGIDLDSIKISQANKSPNKFNFIGVANLADWHGYDRFIRSMATLEKNILSKVIFHIVGDGGVSNSLKKLVRELSLSENVIFYGNLSGDKLDAIFDVACIGVASLGLYRIGQDCITPLKPAEYTARGLPFILGNNDERFLDVDFKYVVNNDDSMFDIADILDWFCNFEHTPHELRQYAMKNFSWEIQMRKIDDFYFELIGNAK